MRTGNKNGGGERQTLVGLCIILHFIPRSTRRSGESRAAASSRSDDIEMKGGNVVSPAISVMRPRSFDVQQGLLTSPNLYLGLRIKVTHDRRQAPQSRITTSKPININRAVHNHESVTPAYSRRG